MTKHARKRDVAHHGTHPDGCNCAECRAHCWGGCAHVSGYEATRAIVADLRREAARLDDGRGGGVNYFAGTPCNQNRGAP